MLKGRDSDTISVSSTQIHFPRAMNTARESYLACDVLKPPGFFPNTTAADNAGSFEASFRNRALLAERDKHKGRHASRGMGIGFQSVNQDNRSFGFGSSPQTSQASFSNNNQPMETWNAIEMNKIHQLTRPLLQPHVLVSPVLPEFSPQKWPHNELEVQVTAAPPHSILAPKQSNESHVQYNPAEYQLPKQQVPPREGVQSTPIRKWKHTSLNSNGAAQQSKRSRKSTSRSKSTEQSSDAIRPEIRDAEKRSKFLERNRAAASKCRQKKKEWTSGLEAHARDLQNNKAQLEMIVGMLKEEIMFLKCEVFKHTSCNCGCRQVRDYFSQESDNMAHAKNINNYQPFGRAPPSSVGTASSDLLGNGSCCPSDGRSEDACHD